MGQQPWGTDCWSLSNFSIKKQPIHCHGETVLLLLLLSKCYDLAQSLITKASGFWQVCCFVVFLALLCQWLYPSVKDRIEVNYIPRGQFRKIDLKLFCSWCVIRKSLFFFFYVLFCLFCSLQQFNENSSI